MTPSAIQLPSRRARKALALTAISVSFLGTAVYWLAAAGGGALAIGAPPGLNASGEIAEVTTLSDAITQSTGNAQLQAGRVIAKADVAKDYTDRMKITVAWTNPKRSSGVLNQNGQISFAIYYPVSTTSGSCTGLVAGNAKLKVTDGSSYCTALIDSATGSPTVNAGQLLLSNTTIAGFMNSTTVAAPSSPADCGTVTDSGSTTTWCQPTGLDANVRRIYIVAAIQNPASKVPPGQQTNVDALSFFIKIRRST